MKSLLPRFSVFIGLRYVGARERNLLVAFLSRVSMVGLVVGVGLLIVVLSIMNGFDRDLREKILSLLPQASVYHREGVADWQTLKLRLENYPRVLAAAPFVEVRALVGAANQAEPVAIYGIDPAAERRVSDIAQYLSEPHLAALASHGDRIVLGVGIAEKLAVNEGDSVMIVVPDNNSPRAAPRVTYVEVAAVLKTNTEVDTKLALMNLDAARALTLDGKVTGMRLKLDDLFDAHDILWGVIMDLGRGYYGNSWLSTHGNLYHAIHMSKRLVGLLMSLIVGIAAFNVVSTLIMVVVEKQGAIAILRTLGASTREIMAVFVVQGTVIGVLGALLGVLFGLGLSAVVGDVMQLFERFLNVQFLKSDVYPLTYLPTQILWQDIVRVVVTAIVLCFLATLYPAWRASRVNPAQTLRYE
ncbi:MAG TPA: lipoprotein-releasing ABC transporter permease subunit [Marinagarivorans sp.]